MLLFLILASYFFNILLLKADSLSLKSSLINLNPPKGEEEFPFLVFHDSCFFLR